MEEEVLARLQERIGYKFRKMELLRHAMTHRSAATEDAAASNERMEFLGDSVVGLIVCDLLLRLFPHHREGDLAKLKAYAVSGVSLASIAQGLGLEECVLMSEAESASGGRRRRSILADAFEALVAAVYLDSGIRAARRLVKSALMPTIMRVSSPQIVNDFKSTLQERTQSEVKVTPVYRIVSELGLEHEKLFTAVVLLGDAEIGTGVGASKKEAEQAAASRALSEWESVLYNLRTDHSPDAEPISGREVDAPAGS